MNQELKAKWLEALRSGRYQQAKGALRHEGSYCCIGVLCDIVDPNAWITDSNDVATWRTKDIYGNLPDALAKELGVTEHCDLLPTLNDRGVPFAELADIIESGDLKGGFERITGRSVDSFD